MGDMNKEANSGAGPTKGSKWKGRRLLATFIVFMLWVMANDDGSDEYCRSGRPGPEWGC